MTFDEWWNSDKENLDSLLADRAFGVARHAFLAGQDSMTPEIVQAYLAGQQSEREASAVMLKFLECVSLDTDCMGPSCYYCDGDELHPPTHRAKQAQDILSAIRKRDEG